MPLRVEIDPDGEKYLAFAKRKLVELKAAMVAAGIRTRQKLFFVSATDTILIQSVQLGRQQFMDRIRIKIPQGGIGFALYIALPNILMNGEVQKDGSGKRYEVGSNASLQPVFLGILSTGIPYKAVTRAFFDTGVFCVGGFGLFPRTDVFVRYAGLKKNITMGTYSIIYGPTDTGIVVLEALADAPGVSAFFSGWYNGTLRGWTPQNDPLELVEQTAAMSGLLTPLLSIGLSSWVVSGVNTRNATTYDFGGTLTVGPKPELASNVGPADDTGFAFSYGYVSADVGTPFTYVDTGDSCVHHLLTITQVERRVRLNADATITVLKTTTASYQKEFIINVDTGELIAEGVPLDGGTEVMLNGVSGRYFGCPQSMTYERLDEYSGVVPPAAPLGDTGTSPGDWVSTGGVATPGVAEWKNDGVTALTITNPDAYGIYLTEILNVSGEPYYLITVYEPSGGGNTLHTWYVVQKGEVTRTLATYDAPPGVFSAAVLLRDGLSYVLFPEIGTSTAPILKQGATDLLTLPATAGFGTPTFVPTGVLAIEYSTLAGEETRYTFTQDPDTLAWSYSAREYPTLSNIPSLIDGGDPLVPALQIVTPYGSAAAPLIFTA